MPIREVRSPNSLSREEFHPRRGWSPGSRSSPSNQRNPRYAADSGQPPSPARRDGGAVPTRWRQSHAVR